VLLLRLLRPQSSHHKFRDVGLKWIAFMSAKTIRVLSAQTLHRENHAMVCPCLLLLHLVFFVSGHACQSRPTSIRVISSNDVQDLDTWLCFLTCHHTFGPSIPPRNGEFESKSPIRTQQRSHQSDQSGWCCGLGSGQAQRCCKRHFDWLALMYQM
jgi:hypothetical protein